MADRISRSSTEIVKLANRLSSTETASRTNRNENIDTFRGRVYVADNPTEQFTGDLKGSVVADDSTVIIDGVSGTIPGYVSLVTLKAEVAASADFAAFKARVASL